MGRAAVLAVAGLMACIALPASASAADEGAVLFDPDAVSEIDFTLSPESRAAIDAEPDEYAPAQLALRVGEQTHGPLTVGFRLRGSTSFRTMDQKASFKIKFNEFVAKQKLLGLKKLTLGNMVQDRSMIHEALAYELFREVGVAAPRTGYSYVRVNGEDYGVYLNIETLDDVSLPRWFDSTGHLYEGGYNVDVRADDIGYFEPDEGDGDDRTDLEAFAAAVADDSAPFSERLEGIADLDQMTKMWAVERFLGHWDGYTGNPESIDEEHPHAPPNNYYLHSDAGGLFSMLPWGTDQTFLRGWSVHEAPEGPPKPYLVFDAPGSLLFDLCLEDEACTESYLTELESLPATVETLGLAAHAGELAAQLAPWQQREDEADAGREPPRLEYSLEQIAAAAQATEDFIRTRTDDLFDGEFWIGGESPLERASEEPEEPVDPPGEPQPVDPAGPAPPDPVRPADPPAPDLSAPETTLLHAPGTNVVTKRRRAFVRFRFAASEPGSSFECRLDNRGWAPCSSPRRLLVDGGDHVFRMRAVDPAGNADPTPARHRWSVAPFSGR